MPQPPTHNQQHFADAYAGVAPWDIDGPQPALASVEDQVESPVLDIGCGTGEHAMFFAASGRRVVGIDFVEDAVRRARSKAAQRNLSVDFRVGDALALATSDERFATILDSGLFHVFADDDRRRYVAGLAHVLNPGGKLLLLCFSDAEPGEQGPRRVSESELRASFDKGWQFESLTRTQFRLNPNFDPAAFSPGGPHAWFAIIKRLA